MATLPAYPSITDRLRSIEATAREAVDADRDGNEVAVAHYLAKLHTEVTVALITSTSRTP